jgi:lipid A 3-O-deacylase
MKKFCLVAVAAMALGQSYTAQAWDASLSVGHTGESTMVYRLGLQSAWDSSWYETSVGRLTGYWDAGITHWAGDKAASNNSISFAPVLRYEFSGESVKPFVDFGIGVAGFQRTAVEGNKLGSSFNFEDRLGAGVKFANGQELSVRLIHYSNAGIKEPNDGIEAYSLNYQVPL